jgi:hypothetical protein
VTSSQHAHWIADGGQWYLADPLVYLRDTLRGQRYTVYDLGNEGHLNHQPPEDHTPYSATGWPGQSPYPVVMAIDIMPKGDDMADLEALARQLIADRDAGLFAALKYINWTEASGECWHTSWQPNKATKSSSDRGHIHLSIRTDFWNSTIKYAPSGWGGSSGGYLMLQECKFGDKGKAVGTLQATLLAYGFDLGPSGVDEDYGPATASALAAAIRDGDGKHFGYWEFSAFMKRVVSAQGGQPGPAGPKGDSGPAGKDGAPGAKGDAAVLPEGATLLIQAPTK